MIRLLLAASLVFTATSCTKEKGAPSPAKSEADQARKKTPAPDMRVEPVRQPPKPMPGPKKTPWQTGSKISVKPAPGNPGGVAVLVRGEAVWPPKGKGCPKLITCCTTGAKAARFVGLACQLALAKSPGCDQARGTLVKILKEKRKTVPKACQP